MPSAKPDTRWTQAAVQEFAKRERVDVIVTSVTRLFGWGTFEGGLSQFEEKSIKAYGVLHGPNLVAVEIEFAPTSASEKIGSMRIDTLGIGDTLPLLSVRFNDEDGTIGNCLVEAHRDALASGRTSFELRLFKREGEWPMTDEELSAGCSNEEIQILGFMIWATQESVFLPSWMRPWGTAEFSLEGAPNLWIKPVDIRVGQVKKRQLEISSIMWWVLTLVYAVLFLALATALEAQNWLATLIACTAGIISFGSLLLYRRAVRTPQR